MKNSHNPISIDKLDRQILRTLTLDARTPYAEMAKKFDVSAGTIHVRVEKMRQSGVIKGTQIRIDEQKLGYDVCCFVGVILKSAKDCNTVIQKLHQFDEVIEAYYTTGNYSIFLKVMTHTIEELHSLLSTKIQSLDEIQSTETIVSLQNPIKRNINPS
ncbi:transcriptional regulator AsnC [Phocoenobacter skyensis]|uniref:Lrp/AsnC family transcriptional regulator, regulator for asnA, asnC and gidA n=1 Tax=Phocoenobacter skyensis TaxID=97481 RepID=A0A1H7WPR6_9PAST|nr:transcriptional regulator AsnC [Pasteurella skyensis]MDP8078985.1 transcriptional regulator AsnC [Pasteurella skyensis]MDP8084935.1 transcriptional regulator AsnC [Pasteurella skyensis]MDP8162848.1 transcriptional regulator AsnC [Pasteurella skyensis]MDP8169934.1 transcriptional regulator AsnC [Pasteurella skyensis]MDP8172565.1 transcriptional regulator AsnC [Pasteurella skyensis]